ncbi:hypothetical protein PsalN5692_03634 (plasmid) [Piscirickettsia salmonis]|uniref:hypothetical protein n=1 Tax=Piscirickettsia salmonis TaxID=1238 RepID=UPI0012B6E22F|nr:hypothetical protein [Piscirickettsia salmonis]QGP52126.1 hypothetical protein PsalN5692_03634 [Piscirickettsia salmonis]
MPIIKNPQDKALTDSVRVPSNSKRLIETLLKLTEKTLDALREEIKNSYFYQSSYEQKKSIEELKALQAVLISKDKGVEKPLEEHPFEFIQAKIRQHCNDYITHKNTKVIAEFLTELHETLNHFRVLSNFFTEDYKQETSSIATCNIGDDWDLVNDEVAYVDENLALENEDGFEVVVNNKYDTTLFQQRHDHQASEEVTEDFVLL